jgi:hypothetical protein
LVILPGNLYFSMVLIFRVLTVQPLIAGYDCGYGKLRFANGKWQLQGNIICTDEAKRLTASSDTGHLVEDVIVEIVGSPQRVPDPFDFKRVMKERVYQAMIDYRPSEYPRVKGAEDKLLVKNRCLQCQTTESFYQPRLLLRLLVE